MTENPTHDELLLENAQLRIRNVELMADVHRLRGRSARQRRELRRLLTEVRAYKLGQLDANVSKLAAAMLDELPPLPVPKDLPMGRRFPSLPEKLPPWPEPYDPGDPEEHPGA